MWPRFESLLSHLSSYQATTCDPLDTLNYCVSLRKQHLTFQLTLVIQTKFGFVQNNFPLLYSQDLDITVNLCYVGAALFTYALLLCRSVSTQYSHSSFQIILIQQELIPHQSCLTHSREYFRLIKKKHTHENT